MRFSVFALSAVPDLPTARRILELGDLDDKSVTKVLFHQRKQQPGAHERLRWSQQMIASMTLIRHTLDDVQVESMNLSTHSETDMLRAYYGHALQHGRMLSWDGARGMMSIIHLRSLLHKVSFPAYWQAERDGNELHTDISSWLASADDPSPSLDELARQLGLPGMLGAHAGELSDAWLRQSYAELQAFSDLKALNSYLIALRVFAVTGELSRHDGEHVAQHLRESLGERGDGHLAAFLKSWSGE